VLIQELIRNIAEDHEGLSSSRVRRRALARGQRPLAGDEESGVIDKNDARLRSDDRAARARLRVASSGLTMAEYYASRAGQDVLLFIDNIFRFVQAGSEVSALLGRMPSAVGYQPTLETEMGGLQERITSTERGSVTSIQAVYVPADDYTDPAPASVFAHLNATTALSRSISEKGIYPAVDPLDSTSTILKPRRRRRRALPHRDRGPAGAAALQGAAGHHRHPRHRRALPTRTANGLPCPQDRALPLAAVLRRRTVHRPHRRVRGRSPRPCAASARSSTGEHDDLSEGAFYMQGSIDQVTENAKAAA